MTNPSSALSRQKRSGTPDGCHAYEAGQADEALEVMEQHPDISVLFTDINMPGDQDGLALACEVHDRWPNVHLILTSGREQPAAADIPDRGQFIAKPYELDVVAGLVTTMSLARNRGN